jgi:hypothetical protein
MHTCAVPLKAGRLLELPTQPQWLLRLPEIIAEISAMDAPVIDRAVLERVFGVRRRRAVDMMGAFGGYQVGRTFVIDRPKLIAGLEQIRQSGAFTFERQRKEHLAEELDRARRCHAGAKVSIPIEKEDLERKAPDFAPGIELEVGRLTVAFGNAEDLLRKLYGLAQAATQDFEAFKNAAETSKIECG